MFRVAQSLRRMQSGRLDLPLSPPGQADELELVVKIPEKEPSSTRRSINPSIFDFCSSPSAPRVWRPISLDAALDRAFKQADQASLANRKRESGDGLKTAPRPPMSRWTASQQVAPV